jgi:isochorismate synthase EntC
MSESPSFLLNWADRDFWKTGAFLTSQDGQRVTLGKGGTFSLIDTFEVSDSPVFYLKDFYTHSYHAYRPSSFVTLSKAHVLYWLNSHSDDHSHISPVENDDDIYEKDFGILKGSFKNGLEKVVLISRETYFPFEKETSIKRLLKKAFQFGTGTPYGIWNPGYGVIGSTPELLYQIEGNNLQTFALAGTARQGQEQELLNSPKDRHEHDLVIRDIREKLSSFAESIEVDETGIEPFKSIVHLKTNIRASLLSSIDLTKLTNTLSPTAALGGYPKEMSLKFLKSSHYSQKYPKRTFGSAFGVISPEVKQFVVSIRNVQWEGQHFFIESGGGIVAESELKKEIEEFQLKRNTIRKHYL